MATDTQLVPPFVGSERGDLWTFDDLAAHGIESFDVKDMEVFDSEGRVLRPVLNGFEVRYEPSPDSPPRPERLTTLIRVFFQRLTKEWQQPFRAEAEACESLPELLALLVRFGEHR